MLFSNGGESECHKYNSYHLKHTPKPQNNIFMLFCVFFSSCLCSHKCDFDCFFFFFVLTQLVQLSLLGYKTTDIDLTMFINYLWL